MTGEVTVLPQQRVIWGEGCLARAIACFAGHGIERPLVMGLHRLAAMEERHVLPHLRGPAGVFRDLPAHVPDGAVEAALEAALAVEAGSIVAHGGGSVLDAAKAVSHLHQKRTGRFLPIAALPTTLSGSEFSHYFGITETGGPKPFKRSYAVLETVPRVVVLDPVLLADTPRDLLLSSAIKSIDHAVEGMRKVGVEHPHAIMAQDGVRRFFDVLTRRPGTDGGALVAADLLQLQLAAWHCYFMPAAVKYGLSHRIGHILGGTFGVPHSITSCVTLAPVVAACGDIYGDRLNPILGRLAGPGESARVVSDAIGKLVRALRLPTRLGEVDGAPGIDQLPEIAALLRDNYPDEVSDLGPDTATKLESLLARLW